MKSSALTKGIMPLDQVFNTEAEKIDVAGSDIYYDGWIFIVSTADSDSVLLQRELVITINGTTMKIKRKNNGSDITIVTNDLPLQKWVHFAVRYKNGILETYLNGKLIKTVHAPGILVYDKTDPLVIGSNIKGYITKVRRLTNPPDSNRIWEAYLEGNGQFSGTLGYLFNYVDDYNAKITIYKNDVKQRDMSLFDIK